MRTCRPIQLGMMPYDDAFSLQKQRVEHLQNGAGEDALLLLEHPHVITLGRNADGGALLASQGELDATGVELICTDRGGDATYHGPGQLVGYPILRLEEGRRDIRRFVCDVEDVLIRTLADFGVDGGRHPEHRGVWVEGRKIASIGIRISKWVTCHGFALNVDTDLSYFSLITPCGISGCEMTSIERETGARVDLDRVSEAVIAHFGDVFEREMLATTLEVANG